MEELKEFLVDVEQMEDIDSIEEACGGSGFGCTCAGGKVSLEK